MPLSSVGTNWVYSLDSEVTPTYTLSNPYPNGFTSAPGNQPHSVAQQMLLGTLMFNIGEATPALHTRGSGILRCSASYRAAWPSRRPTQGRVEYSCRMESCSRARSRSKTYLSAGRRSVQFGAQSVRQRDNVRKLVDSDDDGGATPDAPAGIPAWRFPGIRI